MHSAICITKLQLIVKVCCSRTFFKIHATDGDGVKPNKGSYPCLRLTIHIIIENRNILQNMFHYFSFLFFCPFIFLMVFLYSFSFQVSRRKRRDKTQRLKSSIRLTPFSSVGRTNTQSQSRRRLGRNSINFARAGLSSDR